MRMKRSNGTPGGRFTMACTRLAVSEASGIAAEVQTAVADEKPALSSVCRANVRDVRLLKAATVRITRYCEYPTPMSRMV